MCLEEYSQRLQSDSPTIEFSTEQGKTIVCRNQATEIEGHLESAKKLLQNMIEAKDVPTLDAIHRLRDLAGVLDQLKLQEECLVVGDCAIKLAQALGLRAVELQLVSAETISHIAGLDVYKPRTRPLFIHAISTCEASVIEGGSDSAKLTLLRVLNRAGACTANYPTLCAQWLSRAIDIIEELPSAMVTDEHRGMTYTLYGVSQLKLEDYPKALAAEEHAVALNRTLASKYDEIRHKLNLAVSLRLCGHAFVKMGHLEDAFRVQGEAVSLLRASVLHGAREELRNKNLATALQGYGTLLFKMGRHENALNAQREAVSLYRALTVHGHERLRADLALALQLYSLKQFEMGRHEDALNLQREAISLLRAFAVHGQGGQTEHLADALLIHGGTLHKMDCLEDAHSFQREGVSLLRAIAVHGQEEQKVKLALALGCYGPILVKMGCLEDALGVEFEVVSLLRALAANGQNRHKRRLADALLSHGVTLFNLDRLEDALDVQRETVSLFRALAIHEEQKEKLANALLNYGRTLCAVGRLEDALSAERESVSLFRDLVVRGQEDQKERLGDALLSHGHVLFKMGCLEDALSVRQEAVSLMDRRSTKHNLQRLSRTVE